MKTASFIAIIAFVAASSVEAQFTEIDISSQANANLQAYTFGGNYQLGGTQLNAGGVPFALAELGGDPTTTGAVQSPFSSGGFPVVNSGPFDFTFSVAAGTHATALYSLVNSAWGAPGANLGRLLVTGTLGETATLNLIEGVNVRDHNANFFVNTLSDPTVVTTDFLSGAPTTLSDQTRLDRQVLDLGAAFAGDTIATIDFEGNAPGFPNGSAFLAGLTLAVPDSSLPLPFTAGIFLVMLAAVGISRNQVPRRT